MIYDQAHLDYSHYSDKSEVNIKEKKRKNNINHLCEKSICREH